MKLYITEGSPYARMARIVVLEKRLESRVEIVAAKTRTTNSSYYKINPSGRVPYLVRDDGVGMEESAVICAYLDRLDGKAVFAVPAQDDPWEAQRLGALATSLLDGLSVWNRELTRPESERSPGIIAHEAERSRRMLDVWEQEFGHALMHGPLNMLQLSLACALGLDARIPEFRWRAGHPKLTAWYDPIVARPTFAATMPLVRPSSAP